MGEQPTFADLKPTRGHRRAAAATSARSVRRAGARPQQFVDRDRSYEKRGEKPLHHVLLSGLPGLGKTTLAHVIAQELGVEVRITSGPALERTGDLVGMLSTLKRGDILFIDQVHRLPRVLEEYLDRRWRTTRSQILALFTKVPPHVRSDSRSNASR